MKVSENITHFHSKVLAYSIDLFKKHVNSLQIPQKCERCTFLNSSFNSESVFKIYTQHDIATEVWYT